MPEGEAEIATLYGEALTKLGPVLEAQPHPHEEER
jgi:hypothetical protein